MINLLHVSAEGDDIKFINDYIDFLELKITDRMLTNTEGWTKLPMVQNRFKEATDKNGINIVVFDADSKMLQRKAELEKIANTLDIEFDLFLFPDNQNEGSVENLLLEIINPKYKGFTDCFDQYMDCVMNCENQVSKIPIKSKLFAYLECTGQETKLKNINFLDKEFWDLSNPRLNPLKEFLQKQEIRLTDEA